jgi:hypothetical protein
MLSAVPHEKGPPFPTGSQLVRDALILGKITTNEVVEPV